MAVNTLYQAFGRVEARLTRGSPSAFDEDFLNLSEGEIANSAAVLNALLQSGTATALPNLQQTSLTQELSDISPDLDSRWRGALFALDPGNPDAARHFCTSSREILDGVLEIQAPDQDVMDSNPKADLTKQGRPTRRARVHFLLERKGQADDAVEEFVDEDLSNAVTLFSVLNEGTHGRAGAFDLNQLSVIKQRVEDAIRFLYRILR